MSRPVFILPKEALEEFQDIFEKKYGRRPSGDEALRRGTNLLRLYRAVLLPTLIKKSSQK